MPTEPKVSVVVPIYNMEAYLEQCINSILHQTLTETEIICINDGSPDNSLQILQRYAALDSRIRVINKENQGVSAARNDGILAAKGEYIFFLDPDDFLPGSTILQTLYEKATQNQALICGGSLSVFSEAHPEPFQKFPPHLKGNIFTHEGMVDYATYQYSYAFYRFIYSRRMLVEEQILFPSSTYFEDPPFMVQAMLCAKQFYALPLITYAYRQAHHQVRWTPLKAQHLIEGLQSIWEMATEHRLPRLRQNTWHILRDHYNYISHLLTPEQQDFIRQVDDEARPVRTGFRRFIFSKDKNFLDRRKRQYTILGFKITRVRQS